MSHQISVETEHRGNGRYTYNSRCSCGAYVYGLLSKGAAEAAGRDHQRKQGDR